MFVDYQKARNAVIGTAAAAGAGVAAFFGFGGNDPDRPTPTPPPARIAALEQPVTARQIAPARSTSQVAKPTEKSTQNFIPATTATAKPAPPNSKSNSQQTTSSPTTSKPKTDSQRYADAMKLALGRADKSGTAKDVLGPSSVWKLNLYDDDLDGQYDRGKLDTDRDDVEDEKWTFKQGRWEKDGGLTLWLGGKWVGDPGQTTTQVVTPSQPAVSPDLKRYRAAMQIATSRADRSGKGKDVLGPRSPWKLNLYDDDKDGQWDRAKLDTNRDEIDDEKWNYKKSRWEKDGGSTIWNDNDWQTP